jgi:hypothetical protein
MLRLVEEAKKRAGEKQSYGDGNGEATPRGRRDFEEAKEEQRMEARRRLWRNKKVVAEGTGRERQRRRAREVEAATDGRLCPLLLVR